MAGRASESTQMAAITKVIEVAPHCTALREHVREILESPAFNGSRRSQEFLRHIVEKALDGHFDELKERSLGVELFGRPASYNTGEDAIVRVTASDVRRRLFQFYGEIGFTSEFRVDLHSGSYIPEFRCVAAPPSPSLAPEIISPTAPRTRPKYLRIAVFAIAAGLIAAICVWLSIRHSAASQLSAENVLPWSAMWQSDRQIQLILCDPDISAIQRLLGFNISLSDYANRQYAPATQRPGRDTAEILSLFRGVNVASIDTGIALNISELAWSRARRPKIHTARSLQLKDFKTEDNFILLGSPRSNPWVELFQDQLDFSLVYDQTFQQEVVCNKSPKPGELPLYVPTAKGWGTGDAFAIIAFLGNPNQNGNVLLLAGSNAEGTEAAGKLATNTELLSRTLKAHGIDPKGAPRPFEALLRVRTMAGSPNTFEVIACHALPKSALP
jgi:hypothetical protein